LGTRPRLIVAGGLNPSNVADAIEALAPAVVDVSSGVEAVRGEKSEAKVREFVRAVRGRQELGDRS
ncbi:MAG: hypothetical protein ACRELV_02210, partial [Longimicrobiales bacterium]